MKIYDESGKPLFFYCFSDHECGYYYYTYQELNESAVAEVCKQIAENSAKRETIHMRDDCPWDETEEKIEEWMTANGAPSRIDFNETVRERFGLIPMWPVPGFAKPFDL